MKGEGTSKKEGKNKIRQMIRSERNLVSWLGDTYSHGAQNHLSKTVKLWTCGKEHTESTFKRKKAKGIIQKKGVQRGKTTSSRSRETGSAKMCFSTCLGKRPGKTLKAKRRAKKEFLQYAGRSRLLRRKGDFRQCRGISNNTG